MSKEYYAEWRTHMKKVGYFFSAFLPIIIATAVQFIASIFLMGCTIFAFLIRTPQNSSPIESLYDLMLNADYSTIIMILYSILCISIFGLWYYHSLGGEYLPKISRTFSVAQIAGVAILVPGMQFFSSYLVGLVSMAFPQWLQQYEDLLKTAGLDSSITLPMLLYSVLLAPVCEELIFRGTTMHLARRALPFWLANTMQALLFGLFHMNWIQGIYAFALGLVLGYVCEKGGSIYYSILLHILFNLWGTIISTLLPDVGNTVFTILIILIVTIVSLSLGFYLFRHGTRTKKERNAAKDALTSSPNR